MSVHADYGFNERRPISSDCRDGKHQSCVGAAWDPDLDEPAPCWCCVHNHDQEEMEKWI